MATVTRLTLPLRFRKEEHANSCIEASSLFPLGAKAVAGERGRWFVVIDTARPEGTLRFLKQSMQGIEWQSSDAADWVVS
jgi:hypothetical protein